MSGEISSNPGNRPLSDLLKSMTTGQIWKLIGIIVGTLVGAFFFGFWISEQTSNFELRGKDIELREQQTLVSEMDKERERLEQEALFLSKKMRLLSLLILHVEAEQALDTLNDELDQNQDDPEMEAKLDAAEEKLGEVVRNLTEFVRSLDQQMGASGTSDVRVRLGKGTSEQTITFLQDNSTWTLPRGMFAMAQ